MVVGTTLDVDVEQEREEESQCSHITSREDKYIYRDRISLSAMREQIHGYP